jgi:lysophospholipase L1-like esterase
MNRKLSRRERVTILVCVNVVTIAGLLYGFELFLRLTDPAAKLGLDGVYEGRLYTWGHEVVNNRYGFRERQFPVPKPKDTFRIVVLGDSFTWGAGLAVEQRYTNVLEDLLKAKYPQKNTEVLNFGTPGGPTILQRDILRKYKDLAEPDLIILGFCLNDPQPRAQDYSAERERFDRKYGPTLRRIRRGLSFVGLVCMGERLDKAVSRLAEIVGAIPRWQVALQRTYEKNSPEWLAFIIALKDIKTMSDEMALPPPIFAVLNQGTSTDRPTNYSHPDEELKLYLQWYHQAETTAAELGFTTCNYEKEIAAELSHKPIAVNLVDVHPSKELHRVYAEKLAVIVVRYMVGERAKFGV